MNVTNKVNVMVMAVGSPLGQSILKAVKSSSYVDNLYAADISELAAGFYFENVQPVILPLVKENCYFDELTNFVEKNDIKVIFPTISVEHEFFAKYAAYFHERKIDIVSCGASVFEICNDKYESMQYLRQNSIAAPATILGCEHDAIEEFITRNGFPVVIKPRNGASSNDVFVIKNKYRLLALLDAYPRDYFVVQEYLEDPKDYTAGVYVSSSSDFNDVIIFERDLKFGLSYSGKIIIDENMRKYCLSIANALKSTYSINIQFKMMAGQPYCYEINPRLSSTTSIRAHFGFNEPDMIIRDIIGINPLREQQPAQVGMFMRYWEEIYQEGN
ncbi:ATP-grasp domain-containing protein [Aeromonas salmonicida]|uniref:ATP-grasp domain-containing protein n=1 Tax=Aeromonas salmonicida TaxID=645 RepID=UPI00223F1840|nr:ATP-grasp domain-containing protein [Aeromonas salmonicida]